MTLPDLLTALESRGVGLGIRLVVDAPTGTVDGQIRDALAEHRANLLVRLANEAKWAELRDQRWGTPTDEPENLGCVADDPTPAEPASRKPAAQKALRVLVGLLLAGPIERGSAIALAGQSGVAADAICEAAEKLGVERTPDCHDEVWRLP